MLLDNIYKPLKSFCGMTHLYVTTERFEAETLIEDTSVGQTPKYKYHDIEFREGQNLANRIGFNPMCSVEMNGNISTRELDAIATRLVKEGLYVATDFNGKVLKYIPNDAEYREEMVKLALQKKKHNFWVDPLAYLLFYSNNPNRIKDFRL